MLSPACSKIKSPHTTSSAGMTTMRPPSRRTRQVTLAASVCIRRNAASLPYSDRADIKVAKNTAAAMPAVSNHGAPRSINNRLMHSAMSRMRMIGSEKPERKRESNLFSLDSDRRLQPCCCRDACTCALLSPPLPVIDIPPFAPVYERRAGSMTGAIMKRTKQKSPAENPAGDRIACKIGGIIREPIGLSRSNA